MKSGARRGSPSQDARITPHASAPLVLRSSASNYVGFGIILGPIFLLDAVLTIVSPNFWPGLFACGVLLGVLMGWLASVRLVLDDKRIAYRDWLRRSEVTLAHLRNVQVAGGLAFDKKTNRLLPFRRLVLDVDAGGNGAGSKAYMNPATFSPRDVKELVARLNSQAQSREKNRG